MSKQILTFISVLIIIGFFANNLNAQNIEPPEPIGGKAQMKDFICLEMIYPESSLKQSKKGNVVLEFIVYSNGNTGNYTILKSVNQEMDSEAIRIAHKILWQPATKFDRPVDYNYELEIKYNPKKYKRVCKYRGFNDPDYSGYELDTTHKVFEASEVSKAPHPDFDDQYISLSDFIVKNIEYPEAALKQNISGDVVLDFVVEPYGKISHITVRDSPGGGCGQEAIRLAKLIKWHPGLKEETAVRTKSNITIHFRLNQGDSDYVPNNQNNSF